MEKNIKGENMSGRINISIITKRKLSWMKSDGKCCICKNKIGYYEDERFIGEFAHIEDLQQATKRYNPDKSIEELNNESNIMILCPNCHTEIDKYSDKYSTEMLQEIKRKYENNIKIAIEYSNPNLYAKFSKICKELSKKCNNTGVIEKYESIRVEEKINKNSLNEVKDQIDMYMRYIPIFKEFLQTLSQSEKTELRHNIISLYRQELCNDISNIERFTNLLRSAVGNDFSNIIPAGIIICNYFEECDVFEV